jgi:hypothetical protein
MDTFEADKVAMTCAYGACDYAAYVLNGADSDPDSRYDGAEEARDAIKVSATRLYGYGVITVNDEKGDHKMVVSLFTEAIHTNCEE